MVERIHGKDEVVSSILTQGSIFISFAVHRMPKNLKTASHCTNGFDHRLSPGRWCKDVDGTRSMLLPFTKTVLSVKIVWIKLIKVRNNNG